MKKWLWIDGRLSWPPVVAVVYLTLWLLVVDLAWRLLVLPVHTLLTYAVAIGVAFAAMAILTALRRRRPIG